MENIQSENMKNVWKSMKTHMNNIWKYVVRMFFVFCCSMLFFISMFHVMFVTMNIFVFVCFLYGCRIVVSHYFSILFVFSQNRTFGGCRWRVYFTSLSQASDCPLPLPLTHRDRKSMCGSMNMEVVSRSRCKSHSTVELMCFFCISKPIERCSTCCVHN